MRRLLLAATFCSAFSLLPAWGQTRASGFRGGFRGTAPIARPAFAPRTPMMANRGRGFVPAAGSNFHLRTGFNNNGFLHGNFHHHHHHHFFVANGFGPWWWNSGWGWNPWWYGAYSYPLYGDSPSSSSYDSANYGQQRQMVSAIDELGQEVERLREQQEQARMPAYPPSSQVAQPQTQPDPERPTILVFRDRHTQEVNNYAIVGQTLWLFNEQRARKIPLSEIDVPATTAKNDERGIEFRLPVSK